MGKLAGAFKVVAVLVLGQILLLGQLAIVLLNVVVGTSSMLYARDSSVTIAAHPGDRVRLKIAHAVLGEAYQSGGFEHRWDDPAFPVGIRQLARTTPAVVVQLDFPGDPGYIGRTTTGTIWSSIETTEGKTTSIRTPVILEVIPTGKTSSVTQTRIRNWIGLAIVDGIDIIICWFAFSWAKRAFSKVSSAATEPGEGTRSPA